MNNKTYKHHRLSPRPWRPQSTNSPGNWCQSCNGLNQNDSVTDQKPKLHRIGGHRPHLLDRRILQLTLDGHRLARGKAGARVARALRKFRAQPDCRRVHTRDVARPWLELASPPVTLVYQDSGEAWQAQGPLDVWCEAHDLWRRLDVFCPATVSILPDRIELVFADAGANDWDQEASVLIDRAQNGQSYRWQQGAQKGDLVQFIDMQGNDLVIGLTSMEQIARWPEGSEIVCLLRSYLFQFGTPLTITNSRTDSNPKTCITSNSNRKNKEGQPK
jgi:hypothetical protein